jgi:hypothetical protein
MEFVNFIKIFKVMKANTILLMTVPVLLGACTLPADLTVLEDDVYVVGDAAPLYASATEEEEQPKDDFQQYLDESENAQGDDFYDPDYDRYNYNNRFRPSYGYGGMYSSPFNNNCGCNNNWMYNNSWNNSGNNWGCGNYNSWNNGWGNYSYGNGYYGNGMNMWYGNNFNNWYNPYNPYSMSWNPGYGSPYYNGYNWGGGYGYNNWYGYPNGAYGSYEALNLHYAHRGSLDANHTGGSTGRTRSMTTYRGRVRSFDDNSTASNSKPNGNQARSDRGTELKEARSDYSKYGSRDESAVKSEKPSDYKTRYDNSSSFMGNGYGGSFYESSGSGNNSSVVSRPVRSEGNSYRGDNGSQYNNSGGSVNSSRGDNSGGSSYSRPSSSSSSDRGNSGYSRDNSSRSSGSSVSSGRSSGGSSSSGGGSSRSSGGGSSSGGGRPR